MDDYAHYPHLTSASPDYSNHAPSHQDFASVMDKRNLRDPRLGKIFFIFFFHFLKTAKNYIFLILNRIPISRRKWFTQSIHGPPSAHGW